MDLDYLDYNINRLSNEHLKLNNVTSKLQEKVIFSKFRVQLTNLVKPDFLKTTIRDRE